MGMKDMPGYEIHCPACGTKMSIPVGSKVRCHNPKCNTFLIFTEQYHAGGYQILVRFEP